jgi:pilus assembly protein CpaB
MTVKYGGTMNRLSSLVITGVVAFVLAAFASLLAYNYLKKQTAVSMQTVSIVSAAADLPVGTKLDATNVRMASWPKNGLPAGALMDIKAAVGRLVVRPMAAGDIATEQKLLPLNSSASSGVMSYMVPQGHRAVTVAVNEVAGVAGFISPGNRVDVVLTSALPRDKDTDDNMSRIILQNIPVLATGQATVQKEDKPVIVPTVTLDLLPDEAEKLVVGTKKGTLQLLLRNAVDMAAVSTRGTTIANVLLGRGEQHMVSAKTPVAKKVHKAASPPQAPARYTVEVIMGGYKTTRDFSAQ